MIDKVLAGALESRFSENVAIVDDPKSGQIAEFPAAHEEVGKVTIQDYGNEAVVFVGDMTHGHFSSDTDTASEDSRMSDISDDVIEFLEELFADRVLLWKDRNGESGGWISLRYNEGELEFDDRNQYFLWSGPYAYSAT